MSNERTYTLSQLRRMKGRSDWERVRKTTDKEIDKSISDDPAWAEFGDIDWSKAVLVTPAKKRAISIRLDEDVLDYFRRGGTGYQRRINSVLRHFVTEQRKKERA